MERDDGRCEKCLRPTHEGECPSFASEMQSSLGSMGMGGFLARGRQMRERLGPIGSECLVKK